MASKKAGYNVDSNTQEKITDGARGLYEKATGYVWHSVHQERVIWLAGKGKSADLWDSVEARSIPSTPTRELLTSRGVLGYVDWDTMLWYEWMNGDVWYDDFNWSDQCDRRIVIWTTESLKTWL